MSLSSQTINLLGIPSEWGQPKFGAALGPPAIRRARLKGRWLGDHLQQLGYSVVDAGDVSVPERQPGHQRTKHDGMTFDVPQLAEILSTACDMAAPLLADDNRLIVMGGDHASSIASVAAALQAGDIGVLWIDAHGDMNTPQTTPSGNVHGMPLAIALGDGPPELVAIGGADRKLDPNQVALLGIRDLDPPERDRLHDYAITTLTMRDIDRVGLEELAAQILEQFMNLDRLHISLDLDVIDPQVAPGVGTRVPGGLSYREAHLLMELIGQSGKVYSLDLMEVNPLLDTENRTAELAASLAATLFGAHLF